MKNKHINLAKVTKQAKLRTLSSTGLGYKIVMINLKKLNISQYRKALYLNRNNELLQHKQVQRKDHEDNQRAGATPPRGQAVRVEVV